MSDYMYVPFHVHSMQSNGTTNVDSVTNFRDYVKAAKEYGMPALGFSEHGNIFEWLHKKEEIEAAGMKYLHCIEAYITENLHHADCEEPSVEELPEEYEDGQEKCKKTRDNYHCVLIARNYDGVKELNRLVSKSFDRSDGHFYYMPRITIDELITTSDNIIITTACLGGILSRGSSTIKEKFLTFLISNKDRCFLEIQHHDVDEQIKYNKMLYNLSKSTGLRLIVGTDTHALNEDHMKARAILQKAKGVNFADEASWDLTLKTPNGLLAAYKKQHSLPLDVVIEAMQESVKMADMVEPFEVDRKPKYPKLYGNPEEVFRKKIQDGIAYRHIMEKPNFQEYLDRIEYEFDTYKHNDAIDFMLLEEDYKSEMRRRNVRFGYSRGSVSGSIIAYLLGITEVDSIKYNLNFERFMNKERVSLADVDTDWLSEDRKIVKDYLYTKQGLYCCDIVTFNTIALKGAIKDICRGLYKDNISRLPEELKAEVDKWDKQSKKNKNKSSTNAIPYPEELIKKIEKSSIHKEVPFAYLRRAEEVISLFESDEKAARRKYPEIFYYVDLVNGVIVSVGNHPAGCVVSPYPVNEWFGTFTTSTDEYPISMINMKEVDSLNFVKLDILGLDNIGLIYKTCDAAGIPFLTPDNTHPDDVNVWNSIRDDTTMIFQWESPSATAYLKQLFSDSTVEKIRSKNPNFSYMDLLSIGNGAIRPAGESYREELSKGIYRDNGHKALNDFLAPTLGYLVYQEQIIEFLHRFCGYTMGQADVVRRCISEDSLVLMSNGKTKKIKDIKIGERILSVDENGIIHPDQVSNVFDNGVQETYEISAKHNYKLIATSNHKVLTQRGWIEVGDLTINDFIMTPSKIICDTDGLTSVNRLTQKEMFLIGILLGDGTLGCGDAKFTNSDVELVEAYKECVRSRSRKGKDKIEFSIRAQDGKSVDKIYSIGVKSKPQRDSLNKLIRDHSLNVKATDKHIPENIMLYPASEKIQALLGGLFSTDGGYVEKAVCIEYYSISYQLSLDVKHLLLKFGIYSYINSGVVSGYGYKCYKVRIAQRDSLKLFQKYIIPYVVGRKKREFERIVANCVQNKLSYNYLLPKECKDEIWDMSVKTDVSVRSIIENDDIHLSGNDISVHRGEFGITDTKARKLAQHIYCPYTYSLLFKNYIPIRIKSIKRCGYKHVYDLEVSKHHNYIANDVIVHNCFAKKTGTQSHIPQIKDGFENEMHDKYGVEKNKANELIVNFIKVIEDASSYLFSKNHSDPYSWIGYICGYLRYYYPLEFVTTALNIFESKTEKTASIVEYAKKHGIKICPIKFRHSRSQYSFDKSTNSIFKGTASIKYLGSGLAEGLYELRDEKFENFFELLDRIISCKIASKSQIAILIKLNFFEEFGNINTLLFYLNVYDEFSGKKQIAKTKLSKFGIPVELVSNCFEKETEKQFRGFDEAKFFSIIETNFHMKKESVSEIVKYQQEYLGYIDYINPELSKVIYVLDVNTKYSPKLTVYSLKNGTITICKVRKRLFRTKPIEANTIIRVKSTEWEDRYIKNENGESVPVEGEKELWITDYSLINL